MKPLASLSAWAGLLRAELHLQLRQCAEWAPLLLFFALVIILVPFTLGPEPELLRRIGCGLIWLAVVLMQLMALERLFRADQHNGLLDLWLLSPQPLPLLIATRLLAHSLVLLASVLVMLPPLAIMLNLPWSVLPVLALSLVLGIPLLMLLGGMMAALVLGLPRGAALLTLLLLPFYIPVLIFAVSASDAAMLDQSTDQALMLLGALLALALPTAPYVIALLLRSTEESV